MSEVEHGARSDFIQVCYIVQRLKQKIEEIIFLTKSAVFWDVHRVDFVWTDVSEGRIASIFKVEKSAREEPAWAGACRLSHQSKHPAIL
jgi:hypothetical protein